MLKTVVLVQTLLAVVGGSALAMSQQARWIESTLTFPYADAAVPKEAIMEVLRQDAETLKINTSVVDTPLTIGGKKFKRGLGTHSISHIRVFSPDPIVRFKAAAGIDQNPRSTGSGSVVFSVGVKGKELYRSPLATNGQAPLAIDVPLEPSFTLDLHVQDGGYCFMCDHAYWCDAQITTAGGKTIWLDEIKQTVIPEIRSRYPFSFLYNGKSSSDLLSSWKPAAETKKLDAERNLIVKSWTEPDSGLKVTWTGVQYADFPAVDWVQHFENTGSHDTGIISDVNAMDVIITKALAGNTPFILHKTRGGTPDPQQFEPQVVAISPQAPQMIEAGNGRSSTTNFPFFKIESGEGSFVTAVGWSGNWTSNMICSNSRQLHMTAGMEKTHFKLMPGEKVRSPRILILKWDGDTLESNAQFRQLVYKHYSARRTEEAGASRWGQVTQQHDCGTSQQSGRLFVSFHNGIFAVPGVDYGRSGLRRQEGQEASRTLSGRPASADRRVVPSAAVYAQQDRVDGVAVSRTRLGRGNDPRVSSFRQPLPRSGCPTARTGCQGDL
ncbi:MAG: NPCBM/NEW2 domain-containing protein [Armatimonadota bacterium]